MNVKSLAKLSVMGIIAFVVCILLLPAVVDAKDPIRPFKMSAEGYKIGEEHVNTGEGTHVGSLTNIWTSVPDVNNPPFPTPDHPWFYTGYGTMTAANGDTIEWINEYTVAYNGVTGLFAALNGYRR